MAWIITGSESDHIRIRHTIVNYMEIYDISRDREHIGRMAAERTYGEDWELAAFASALNTTIHVFSVENNVWEAIPPYSEAYGTIHTRVVKTPKFFGPARPVAHFSGPARNKIFYFRPVWARLGLQKYFKLNVL